MKTVILMLLALSATLTAKVEYVGDSKAEFYYNNDRAVKTLVKQGTTKEIVVYYVKVRKSGKTELSNAKSCCYAKTLAGGQCFKLVEGAK